MITSKQLVDYTQHMLDIRAAYWYGTFGQRCSAALHNSKKAQYPSHYSADRLPGYKADIAAGKTVVDCVGMIKGAAWSNGGAYAPKYDTNGCPDKSADGMYAWCLSKGMDHGAPADIPEVPGLFLHMGGHCGVYIGDGWVIEAKGFADDVKKTRLAGRGWKHWAKLPFVKYEAPAVSPPPPVIPPPLREPVIVDVSQHSSLKDRRNDWAKIAKNVDLLILRCGVTRTQTKPLGIGIDDEFSFAAKKCQKYNIPFGVYYYGKVRTVADARKEARKAYASASPLNPLFYVYDVEESRLTNAIVEAWMDEIRDLGAKRVGLYIAHHMFTRFTSAAKKADFVWVPRYGKNTGKLDKKPDYPCDLHQFTSVGKVPGFFDTTLDLNRLTGTKPLSWFLQK